MPTKHNILIVGIVLALIIIFVPLSLFLLNETQKPQQNNAATTINIEPKRPTPPPTGGPTADWKFYEDAKNGFSVKYPPSWSLRGCLNGKNCSVDDSFVYIESERFGKGPSDQEGYFYYFAFINVVDNPKKLTIKDLLEEGYPPEIVKDASIKEESINNLTAYRIYPLPGRDPVEVVYFKRNDGSYISIGFTPEVGGTSKEESKKYYAIFNQILSTFKFLDNLESPSPTGNTNQVFCTQEVKQCPDGSYVGRTGPKCEFAPCPSY